MLVSKLKETVEGDCRASLQTAQDCTIPNTCWAARCSRLHHLNGDLLFNNRFVNGLGRRGYVTGATIIQSDVHDGTPSTADADHSCKQPLAATQCQNIESLCKSKSRILIQPTSTGMSCPLPYWPSQMDEAIGVWTIDLQWVLVHFTSLLRDTDPNAEIKMFAQKRFALSDVKEQASLLHRAGCL